MTKMCSKCGEEKGTDEFGPDKKRKDGLTGYCRACLTAIAAECRAKNPEAHREAVRRHRANNLEESREQDKIYKREMRANEAPEARERRLQGMREYQSRVKPWKNRKRTPRDVSYARKYTIEKYHADPGFAVQMNISRRIRAALGKQKKSATLAVYLGCTLEELRLHLQGLFKPGMTWGNYGEWHVDHKKPCASFDLTDSEQQKQCFHFSNLQPLWAKENLLKGASV